MDYSDFAFLALIPLLIPAYIGLWKLYEKAGEEGWKAIIPVYSTVIWLRIIGRPWWWILMLLIPIVNVFYAVGIMVDLMRSFGKEKFHQIAACILIPFIYLPYLGFKKDIVYKGKASEIPQGKKSVTREWADAIIFAVVAATLIRWMVMEAYTIPTPSMENSLLVGDFLFVSKFHYGTRTPRTPLQVPLTHQKIWFTEIPSYVNWVQLPSYRLPGISHVKREDVVVFNVPGIAENNYMMPQERWIDYPVDLKTNYIKRCVGIPGDVLQVKDRQLIINDQPLKNPENMQYRYHVISKDEINQRNFEKLGLDPEDYGMYGRTAPDQVEYSMFLSAKKVDELKALPFIKSVELPKMSSEADTRIFAASKYAPWNGDNFGPLTLPKEGMTIDINDSTLAIYGSTIRDFDHNENAKIENGKLTINGKEVTKYTFNQNYYFMMGDNRDNSLDSRYWGFVPEDHIVGKGFFIWLSLDKYGSYFSKIRWRRFFKLID